jgi:hypothetical protein
MLVLASTFLNFFSHGLVDLVVVASWYAPFQAKAESEEIFRSSFCMRNKYRDYYYWSVGN